MDEEQDPRLPPPISFSRIAIKPPYETSRKGRHHAVMSLCAYCIKSLSLAEIHNISDLESCWTRRSYDSAMMKRAVVELLPFIPLEYLGINTKKKKQELPLTGAMHDNNASVSLSTQAGMIHPQLWGLLNTLIIPSTLPPVLRYFSLSLTDKHVPSLQSASIISTPTLSLLTYVSFSSSESRMQVTDHSLLQLRTLSCLTVLNLSATPITSSGVLRFIASLRAMLPSKVCPWRLRVLDLRRTFVDDELIMGNKNGLSLQTFPMLFAVDLRDTSVSSVACKEFQCSWGTSSCTPPLELFHPKPSHIIVERVSSLINAQPSKSTGEKQHEHPFLMLDEAHNPAVEVLSSKLTPFTPETDKKDQDLRAKTSGVVILTAKHTILGNVSELSGGNEEGSAQGCFRTNNATVAELGKDRMRTQRPLPHGNRQMVGYPGFLKDPSDIIDDLGLDSESWDEYGGYNTDGYWDEDDGDNSNNGSEEDDEDDGDDGGESTSNEDTGPDLEEEEERLGTQDNTYDHQFKDCVEQGFILYRDPPDLSALSQLDELKSTQGSKKRLRSDNETFTVKRRKGTTMSQIFGSNASSIFPRRL